MNKIYCGIGSRSSPPEALRMMSFFSLNLIQKGYTLRSGGAPGADQEFEWAAASSGLSKVQIQAQTEIYLPWPDFEQKNRSWIKPIREEPQNAAYAMAEDYHPAWNKLSQGAKRLHARNVHQIYGFDVLQEQYILPDFVICWTEGGKMKGGTAQALRIAQDYKVKIYNLGKDSDYDELVDWIVDV